MGLVSQKAGRGEKTKQASVSASSQNVPLEAPKPRRPLDNKYSLYYHETKNKQPSTFQYADSEHLWLFHTRF